MRILARIGLVLLIWLVIPAALGVVGYYFIGPNIGKSTILTNLADKAGLPASKPAEPDTKRDPVIEEGEPASKKYGEPEVEIMVSKTGKRARTSETNRPRRRVKRAEPRTEPAPESAPEDTTPSIPEDEGGSGGAGGGETTGGETTGGELTAGGRA